MGAAPSLNRLRALRVARVKDAALAPEFERLRADLSRRRRGGGGAEAAWEVVVPDALREKAEVVGLSRGVLNVRVRHASARFELDRFLRSGGEAALIRAAMVAIKRVRILA
jgi:hypothetical protein